MLNAQFNNDAQIIAALEEEAARQEIFEQAGIPYIEGEWRPPNTHVAILLPEHEAAIRDALQGMGLGNFEQLLQFQYFKEPEGRKTFIAPIKAKSLETKVGLIQSAVQHRDARDPCRQELEEMLAAIMPAQGENLSMPDVEDTLVAPRVLVIDLLMNTYKYGLVMLNDLNPAELKKEMEHEGVWEQLMEEIPLDSKNHRATIQKFLDEALANTQNNQPEATLERFHAYVQDGAWHEIAHGLSNRFPKPMEIDFFNLVMTMPKGRLFFKNMTKALHGMYKYRQGKLEEAKHLAANGDDGEAADLQNRFVAPSERTKNMAMAMFASEVFADLFAMYLKETACEMHIYGEYGETITPQIRTIFDRVMQHFQSEDAKKRICVASALELRQSRMYQGQKILAA